MSSSDEAADRALAKIRQATEEFEDELTASFDRAITRGQQVTQEIKDRLSASFNHDIEAALADTIKALKLKTETVPEVFQQPGFEGMIILAGRSGLDELRRSIFPDIAKKQAGRAVWQDFEKESHEVDIPGVGTYRAEFSKHDLDRLAHACQSQVKFYAKLREADWKDNNEAKPYATFEEFEQEARLCAIGYDYNFKPLTVKDEVERAWGLMNAARNNNDFISICRSEDAYHTGYFQYGYATEFGGDGAVLFTSKYTELENISWVVSAAKKGLSVVPLSVLMGLTREELAKPDAPKPRSDIRDDDSRSVSISEFASHDIISATTFELAILKACGYSSHPHDTYGAIWLPDMTGEAKEARDRFSLVQARALFEDAKFTQAFSNLTGEAPLDERLGGFLTTDPGVVQIIKAHMARLKEGGTGLDNPISQPISRVDFKARQALSRLARRGPANDWTQKDRLHAMQEISEGVVGYFADKEFTRLSIPDSVRRLITLALNKQIATDINAGNVFDGFTLKSHSDVTSFIEAHQTLVEGDVVLVAARTYIDDRKLDCFAAISSNTLDGTPLNRTPFDADEGPAVCAMFEQRVGFALAIATSGNLVAEFGEDFLRRYLETHYYLAV